MELLPLYWCYRTSNFRTLIYYKKSCSIVLLVVVDADYLFTAVDIGSYGSSSDSGILNNCPMGVDIEQQQFNRPRAEPRNADSGSMAHYRMRLLEMKHFRLNFTCYDHIKILARGRTYI